MSSASSVIKAITVAPAAAAASAASSAVHSMSARECDNGGGSRKRLRIILFSVLAVLLFIATVCLIIYAVLHPHRPRFILQDSILYTFKLQQSMNLVTTTMQVTVSSRNPNDAIGIYFENLEIFASYKNEPFTLPTMLPETYVAHKDYTLWSPFLNGSDIPVNGELGKSLTEDWRAGMTLVKIDGRVKWKVGSWVSNPYRIHVNCPAYILFGDRNNVSRGGGGGGGRQPAFRDQFVKCSVDV